MDKAKAPYGTGIIPWHDHDAGFNEEAGPVFADNTDAGCVVCI